MSNLLFLLCQYCVYICNCINNLLFSDCKKFGSQSWVILAIVSTEFLIVAKFDPVTITKPLPGWVFYYFQTNKLKAFHLQKNNFRFFCRHIALFWLIGIICIFLWTIWNFGLLRRLFEKPKQEKIEKPKSEEIEKIKKTE